MKHPEALTYHSDSRGYMIYYQGKSIGGAGTLSSGTKRHWRHVQADVKMYGDCARRIIAELQAGRGEGRFIKAIDAIDRTDELFPGEAVNS